jgi:hypothetical protein
MANPPTPFRRRPGEEKALRRVAKAGNRLWSVGESRRLHRRMATTFWSVDGRPMSAAEFITRLFGDLPELFKDEDELRALWGQPDTRKALLQSLSDKGYGDEQLNEIKRMIDAEKSNIFDVLAYIAFALSPITREERVNARRAQIFSHYDHKLQAFLNFVLSQYVKEGDGELDQEKLPHLLELKYRAVSDAADQLGGVTQIRNAFTGFQRHLYAPGPAFAGASPSAAGAAEASHVQQHSTIDSLFGSDARAWETGPTTLCKSTSNR